MLSCFVNEFVLWSQFSCTRCNSLTVDKAWLSFKSTSHALVRVSNPDMGVNLDPTDKVFFFADCGSPGGPN